MDDPLLMQRTQKVASSVQQGMARFVQKWGKCKECSFGIHGGNKGYFRGYVPAEVLIIAECLTDIEHSTRLPMTDTKTDAGKTLDRMILNSAAKSGKEYKWCVTNMVLCTPFDEARDMKTPKLEQLGPCSHRLHEFIQLVKPKLIFRMGVVAQRNLPNSVPIFHGLNDPPTHCRVADIKHPAWMEFQKDPFLEEKKMMFHMAKIIGETL